MTLTRCEREEFEKLKQSLMIVWRKSTPPTIDAAFFWWCRCSNKPYIRISKRGKSADVMMELPNESRLLDSEGSEQLRLLCRSYGVPEAENNLKNPRMDGVPLDLAEDFAQKLLVVGLDYCRRNSP